MISGGKTQVSKAVATGRKILCRENPTKPARSQCAKSVSISVKNATRGLTTEQQKLWRQIVYRPAVFQVSAYCKPAVSKTRYCDSAWTGPYKCGTIAVPKAEQLKNYLGCVTNVVSDAIKFKGFTKKDFKFTDYLTKGAQLIKANMAFIKKILKGTKPRRKPASSATFDAGGW